MTDTAVIDEAEKPLRAKRDVRPQVPAELWVAHPNGRQVALFKEHAKIASQQGWFYAGVRGFGQDLEPLPPELDARLGERDELRDRR